MKRKKKLSLCCPLFNRGNAFTNLYKSLEYMLEDDVELVIVDYGSNDIDLRHFKITLIETYSPFRRAAGCNLAAANASGQILFFIDADMIAPFDFNKTIYQKVKLGQAYFPICFSLNKDKPRKSDWSFGW